VLVGNHELAILVGTPLFEQTPESPLFRPVLREKVLTCTRETAWKVATVVDGVLLTHAGVSETYERVFAKECQGDPTRLAAYLNRQFLVAVRRELLTGERDQLDLLGVDGPVWFRPRPYSSQLPLAGVTQVVGHTPPEPQLEMGGFFMVDPCVFRGVPDTGRYRYATIQDGRVQVREGTLRGLSRPGRLRVDSGGDALAVTCQSGGRPAPRRGRRPVVNRDGTGSVPSAGARRLMAHRGDREV